jgi:HlyD family secretion protein
VAVRVEEGARVRAGDTLVVLAQAATQGAVPQQAARVAASRARLREVEAGPRAAEIAQAQAQVRSREAEAGRAARDAERYRPLAARGIVSRQTYDQARAAASVAASQLDASRQSLRLLREGARAEAVESARAEVAGAQSALDASRATAAELTLVAPVDGVVLGRWAEPGETVAAGETVLTVGRTSRPYTRVYVNERVLPRIRVGQRLTATLDGLPGRPFPGRVVSINDKAEYTPRIALTETERADLLFGVKVELSDPAGALKAGLPVTVTLPEAR